MIRIYAGTDAIWRCDISCQGEGQFQVKEAVNLVQLQPISLLTQLQSRIFCAHRYFSSFSLDDDKVVIEDHFSVGLKEELVQYLDHPIFFSFDPSNESTVSYFDITREEKKLSIQSTMKNITCLKPISKAKVVVGNYDGSLECLDVHSEQSASQILSNEETPFGRLTYDYHRKILTSCSTSDNSVNLMDMSSSKNIGTINMSSLTEDVIDTIYHLDRTPYLIVGDCDGSLFQLDIRKLRMNCSNDESDIIWRSSPIGSPFSSLSYDETTTLIITTSSTNSSFHLHDLSSHNNQSTTPFSFKIDDGVPCRLSIITKRPTNTNYMQKLRTMEETVEKVRSSLMEEKQAHAYLRKEVVEKIQSARKDSMNYFSKKSISSSQILSVSKFFTPESIASFKQEKRQESENITNSIRSLKSMGASSPSINQQNSTEQEQQFQDELDYLDSLTLSQKLEEERIGNEKRNLKEKIISEKSEVSDSAHYISEILTHILDTQIIKKIEDVEEYIGDWKDINMEDTDTTNKKKGRREYPNTSFYDGGWEAGRVMGEGLYSQVIPGGILKYDGEFTSGVMYSQFEGSISYHQNQENEKNEEEKCNWMYRGEWRYGKFDGNGELKLLNKNKNEHMKLKGRFVNGRLDGEGTCEGVSASSNIPYKFFGAWKNGRKHGPGILHILKNNSKNEPRFEGSWSDGKRNGVFKYYVSKTTTTPLYCVYFQGKMMQKPHEEVMFSLSKNKNGNHNNNNNYSEEEEKIKNDRDFITSLVEYKPEELIEASHVLKSDKELVMKAVSKNPDILIHMNPMFVKEEELFLEILSVNGFCISSVLLSIEESNNNIERMIETALKQDPNVLSILSEKVQRKNFSSVITGLCLDGLSLRYFKLQPEMQKDEDGVESAVMGRYFEAATVSVLQNPIALRFVHEEFSSNPILLNSAFSSMSSKLACDSVKFSLESFCESLILSQIQMGVKKDFFGEKNESAWISEGEIEELCHMKGNLSKLHLESVRGRIWKKLVENTKSVSELGERLKIKDVTVRRRMDEVFNGVGSRVFNIHPIGDDYVYFGFLSYPIEEKSDADIKNYRHGFGIVFKEYRGGNYYKIIFSGSFKGGKRFGEGKEYNQNAKLIGKVVFEGGYRDGLREGKGRELLYLNPKDDGDYIEAFEGFFRAGVKHGRGEAHDPKNTGKVVRGVWENGVLDEKSVSSFSCPIIQYSKLQKHFKNSSILGSGAYGIVYKVKSSLLPSFQTDAPFIAVKVMKMNSLYECNYIYAMVKRGIGLCCSFDSAHVLKIHSIIKGARHVGYSMELCKLSVDKVIETSNNTLGMDEKIRLLHETALGIRSMHRKLIMHRDLKWANIMMDDHGKIKITDFDTLKEDEKKWRLRDVVNSSRIGTTGFLAPEVFLGKDYTLSCDVYAYSLMIYALLWELNFPYITQYSCPGCDTLVENIIISNCLDYHVANCKLRPLLVKKEMDKFPKFLIDLMILSWSPDVHSRPTIEEICEVFEKEKEKDSVKFCYSVVFLQFHPKHAGEIMAESSSNNNNIKMLLIKPEVGLIKTFVEKKYVGTTVAHVTDLETGAEMVGDDDVLRILVQRNKDDRAAVFQIELGEIGDSLKYGVDNNIMNNNNKMIKEEKSKEEVERERMDEEKDAKIKYLESELRRLEETEEENRTLQKRVKELENEKKKEWELGRGRQGKEINGEETEEMKKELKRLRRENKMFKRREVVYLRKLMLLEEEEKEEHEEEDMRHEISVSELNEEIDLT